ncbi:MAG: hypothetical protein RMK57_10380 [Bryobacterales bacterium]|nr:hypothetical protein [Bryobacteraceae bacterium]MDW8354922.1 hypothetical protein [Bryobacterales bacterium]
MQDYGPIRLALAVLAVSFAYLTGLTAGARRRGVAPLGRLYRWILRTAVASLAVLVSGGLDPVSGVMLAVVTAGVGIGFLRGRRAPKPPEDLSKLLFPKE